jgi:hypothetical protein
MAVFYLSLAIANSGALASLGFYVSKGSIPLTGDIAQYFAIGFLLTGIVCLSVGIAAVIGGIIGKTKGSIIMIISGALSLLSLGILGIIPFALLLSGGIINLHRVSKGI